MIGKKLKPIFGVGEISRFDPQIRQAFTIMDKSIVLQQGGCNHIRRTIEALGFDYKHSSGDTFIGKRQVIKMALFVNAPPEHQYRIPTVIYSHEYIEEDEWDWNYVVAIQPRVNKFLDEDDEGDHVSTLEQLTYCDCHAGNIGIYNRKVRLFDW